RAFVMYAPGLPLAPPHLLPAPAGSGQLAGSCDLPSEATKRISGLVAAARPELLRQLGPLLRKEARSFAEHLLQNRPKSADASTLLAYTVQERETANSAAAAKWRRCADVVKKQTSDWLSTSSFAQRLTEGVTGQKEAIDSAISALAEGWSVERQVAVDRNILRIAGYELLYAAEIPVSATINEAVELAKKYSTAESGKFVNGVLGALAARISADTAHAAEEPQAQPQDIEEMEEPDLD
ncbi:MAG TPA: transcription antitermination factor NusB, partial [Chthonomonadales bacterium]|nr:transcription antitermination factor NusB [Chthonomonadales bacterium]